MALTVIAPYEMPAAPAREAGGVGWRPDPSRAALLIHDMQQYFVSAFPAGAAPVTDLVANIGLLRAHAVALGIPVIYTAQPGAMTLAERGLLHDFWGPGMGSDISGKRIITPLTPEPRDVVLTKWRYSAFHSTMLANILHQRRRDQLIVCGVYAHIGCLMTACDAFTRDIEPFLVSDAVADFSLAQHQMGLDYAARCCAVTVNTRTVLADLAGSRDPGGRALTPVWNPTTTRTG
jgi:bifunctional isochorismate lyase/aryl carrier protein